MNLAEKKLLEAQQKVYDLSNNHVKEIEQIIVEGAKKGLASSTIKTKMSDYRSENDVPRDIKLPNGRFDELYKRQLMSFGDTSYIAKYIKSGWLTCNDNVQADKI